MLSCDFLEAYASREATVGQQIADALLSERLVLQDPLALYPEYVPFGLDSASVGLHRPGVNVALLLFFYPRAIVYVPPLTRDAFEARFGIDRDTFAALSDPNLGTERFLYPVLNHPARYAEDQIRDFLEPLLHETPPTWERWHVALDVSGGNDWFRVADAHLRLDDLLKTPGLVPAWRVRHSVASDEEAVRDIRQQARNRFVDLCLVGLEDEAIRICRESGPSNWFALLDYSSEVFAYPFVMGAGGAFNYVTRNAEAYAASLRRLRTHTVTRNVVDADVLRVLLEGFEFHKVPRVFLVDYLLHYHRSAQAVAVRSAYRRLLNIAARAHKAVSVNEVIGELQTIIEALKLFCASSESHPQFRGRIERERHTVHSLLCAVGSALAGIHGLVNPQIPLTTFTEGVAFTTLSLLQPTDRQFIRRAFVARHYPGLARYLNVAEGELLALLDDAEALAAFRRGKLLELLDRGNVDFPVSTDSRTAIQQLWVPEIK